MRAWLILGQDVARLVWPAYPSANGSTREVIGVNAFLDALPGRIRDETHMIHSLPRNLRKRWLMPQKLTL